MWEIIKIINGQKTRVPLTADAGAGNPVGTIIPMYKKSNPNGYLYCDGSTFDQTKYPLLYAYLGSNVLPDYREFALVGAEENTTDVYDASTNPTGTIHSHDVYTEGEAKDDQIQDHKHKLNIRNGSGTPGGDPNVFNGSSSAGISGSNTGTALDPSSSYAVRKGTVTRGKRKAVYFYIKATSGLTEGQQDDVVNIINQQRSYSTEEHLTGRKWIDGKPTYEKTIDCGAMPNNATKTVAHNISNLKKVISFTGNTDNGNGNNLPLPYVYASDANNNIGVSVDNTYVRINTKSNLTSLVNSYVTIEYTKTTD